MARVEGVGIETIERVSPGGPWIADSSDFKEIGVERDEENLFQWICGDLGSQIVISIPFHVVCKMAKINMSQEKIERLLEQQKKQRRERRRRRQLSHIDEDEMVEPAKQSFEEILLGDGEIVEWYREPSVQIRERHRNESPAVVHEKPDLICEINMDGVTLFYVIELKKILGKKGIGQALLYYWAVDNGIELKYDGKSRRLPESMFVFSAIGFIKMNQQYYGEFLSWLSDSLKLEGGVFTAFPVDMSESSL